MNTSQQPISDYEQFAKPPLHEKIKSIMLIALLAISIANLIANIRILKLIVPGN